MQEFSEGPWSQQNLDPGSGLIIPVPKPLGGAIVVGEHVVTYLGAAQPMRAAPILPALIKVCAHAFNDGVGEVWESSAPKTSFCTFEIVFVVDEHVPGCSAAGARSDFCQRFPR